MQSQSSSFSAAISKNPNSFQSTFVQESLGAVCQPLFVTFFIDTEANLGANVPKNYSFLLSAIFGIEVLATAFLMAVIFAAVYTKGLKGWSRIAIGGMAGLDIFSFPSSQARIDEPSQIACTRALLSGAMADLWFYWSATFIGSTAVALLCRKKFRD